MLSFMVFGLPPSTKKVYKTQPVTAQPPSIDGKLNDPAWENLNWEGEFIQRDPYEGQQPSQQTSFKILYDNNNLYVAIRAHDKEPGKIVRRVSRRDSLEGDWVSIDIDSYHDLRTAFSFAVNAEGVKYDEAITEDGEHFDSSWDPLWTVKTSVDNDGWIAEMCIPFSQLRFANSTDHVWGMQVTREIFRNKETSHWQFIPKDAPGWVNKFGELQGLKQISNKKERLEITPYTLGKLQYFQAEEGNPFATGRLRNAVLGLDGKIRITSDLTMDFTINPDFGQVEADPSEVNLTTFETFFQEKRPFFIEGRNILNFQVMGGDGDFSMDNLFYSRRIGRAPRYEPNTRSNEFMSIPTNTSILGAFKLTGKTKNGISIGIMENLTGTEKAEIAGSGDRRFETVEPLTNYLIMRVQKDYNKGNTIIGGMLTATNRFIGDNDTNLAFLHRAAYTGGLDFLHTWKNKKYYISLKTIFSHVLGDEEAILRTQRSPTRYFQRTDADHIEVDPNRTSLSGHGGTLSFGKSGNSHLLYSMGVTWRSPGLELNDTGYLRQADRIMQWLWVGYRIWKPFSIFKNLSISFNQWKGWDFSGENIFDGGNINFMTHFKNNWGIGYGINRQGQSISTTALRGGPSIISPGGWSQWVEIGSDNRKHLVLNGGASFYNAEENNSDSSDYYVSLTYRPASALSISVQPGFSKEKRQLQYVNTVDFLGEKRYIFAAIDQKTISVTFRVNYSITPDLSLQFYGQPFISAGKYSKIKRITTPRAPRLVDRFHAFSPVEIQYNTDDSTYYIDENQDGAIDYTVSNPNFNFFQFRSNLVVRWEYRPGSTLYLVWSQGRTGFGDTGDFSFSHDFKDLFQVKPHDVFLVKFTYRFGM